ncbi:diguanylate cyclase, partial [Escherichia coli]|uniref:diguanylate cyclase n=1 Tax=Escherichia coli TaxID=562 RepID=UPI00390A4D99
VFSDQASIASWALFSLHRRKLYEYRNANGVKISVKMRSPEHYDLYGHSKGDEVLCALARTLESCARKGDLVFRWGGEEFVLLLPRTPLDTALSLAETIRVSVAKVSISGLPRFTVSIGVAHHEGNESIDELFKRVDDALYRAKNDGRNRVLAA